MNLEEKKAKKNEKKKGVSLRGRQYIRHDRAALSKFKRKTIKALHSHVKTKTVHRNVTEREERAYGEKAQQSTKVGTRNRSAKGFKRKLRDKENLKKILREKSGDEKKEEEKKGKRGCMYRNSQFSKGPKSPDIPTSRR